MDPHLVDRPRTFWNTPGTPTGPGISKRWVLRAMGEAAMKTGSRYVAFGTRSLSIATGLDHTTVAAHLRALREEDDPLIDLIENDRGLAGDLYQLRIPDEITVRATTHQLEGRETARAATGVPGTRPHRRLRLRSPRAHHGAGRSAASTSPARPGCPGRAVYEALETLAAWNLVEPRRRPVGHRGRHQPADVGRAIRLRRHRPQP